MTRRSRTVHELLGTTGRRRQEDVGPRRADCAREGCADGNGMHDPWYVHASQWNHVPVTYDGDCAACALRGARCAGYLTPRAALIADEPEIPDEPTPASIAGDGVEQGRESHATTSPPNFQSDSHPDPQPTAAEIAARLK